MKNHIFVTDQVYHLYNRGIEKRDIFLSQKDYYRFIHDLFEFNDEAPALNTGFYFQPAEKNDFQLIRPKPRKLLVEILCFCAMPNHYHLMVRQRIDNGITNFMRKLGTGYTNYFNTKYQRVGHLFQGKFKAVRIEQESHFLYLPYYIHLNPLDLCEPEWREQRIHNLNNALQYLDSYRWSSYLDYNGIKNFPSVIQPDFLLKIYKNYGSPTSIDYRGEIRKWLENIEIDAIKDVAIE